MKSETPALPMVVRRLEKVERQNRRLKVAGAAALILLSAASVMGQAMPDRQTIEARSLMLLGADGKARVRLEVTEEGPSLSLLDAHQTQRVELSAQGEKPRLRLYDAKGQNRLELVLTWRGDPAVSLSGADGKARAILIETDGEAGFSLLDASGKTRWMAPQAQK